VDTGCGSLVIQTFSMDSFSPIRHFIFHIFFHVSGIYEVRSSCLQIMLLVLHALFPCTEKWIKNTLQQLQLCNEKCIGLLPFHWSAAYSKYGTLFDLTIHIHSSLSVVCDCRQYSTWCYVDLLLLRVHVFLFIALPSILGFYLQSMKKVLEAFNFVWDTHNIWGTLQTHGSLLVKVLLGFVS
jgi:hypothetical protein